MENFKLIGLVLIAGSITGCAAFTPKDLANPSEVTLEQALTSVGAGLYQMKKAQKGMKTGLIASSVNVTFKLAASAKDSGKLTIDLSRAVAADPATSNQSIGGEKTSESSASRSNEITVKFVNVLTIPKDTLAYSKSADELEKIILIPSAGGWTTFGTGINKDELLKIINSQKK